MSGDQDMSDAAGPEHRRPQIEALSQRLNRAPSYEQRAIELWPGFETLYDKCHFLHFNCETTQYRAPCAGTSALILSSALLSSTGQSGQINELVSSKEVNCSLSLSHNVGVHVHVHHTQFYDMGCS